MTEDNVRQRLKMVDATSNANESAYFELLATRGNVVPVDGHEEDHDLKLPDWYDEEKVKRGQKYFHDNIFTMFVGMLYGLLTVLAIPSIIKVLIHTQRSNSDYKSYVRYMETIFHMLAWYKEDLKPESRAFKSINHVRKLHAFTSKRTSISQVGIISQTDLVITQFGFMGFVVLQQEKMGVKFDRNGLEGFIHLWRVLGHLHGIKDEYNLCTDSVETLMHRLRLMNEQILKPAMSNTNAEFDEYSKNLINGMWHFNPFLNHEAFIFALKRMIGVNGYTYWTMENTNGEISEKIARMTKNARVILWLLLYTLEKWLKFSIFQWFTNSQMRLSLFLIHYFPFLAYITYGVSKSYVRILK